MQESVRYGSARSVVHAVQVEEGVHQVRRGHAHIGPHPPLPQAILWAPRGPPGSFSL